MLRVWVHGCDPGRVSDGSRLALCQTLSIECPSSIFSNMCILLFLFLSLCRFCLFMFLFCSHRSFADVPLIFFCPADHVPDWQPRILLGMVEARSVNVKKTTTTCRRRHGDRQLYARPLHTVLKAIYYLVLSLVAVCRGIYVTHDDRSLSVL